MAAYGAKFPKAAAKITDDREELLAFFDYPAQLPRLTCVIIACTAGRGRIRRYSV